MFYHFDKPLIISSNPQLSPSTSFLCVHVLSLLNYQINWGWTSLRQVFGYNFLLLKHLKGQIYNSVAELKNKLFDFVIHIYHHLPRDNRVRYSRASAGCQHEVAPADSIANQVDILWAVPYRDKPLYCQTDYKDWGVHQTQACKGLAYTSGMYIQV